MELCFFQCCKRHGQELSTWDESLIQTVQYTSRQRHDNVHLFVKHSIINNENIKAHTSCTNEYFRQKISKSTKEPVADANVIINRVLKKLEPENPHWPDILTTELSHCVTSLFKPNGQMNPPTKKCTLMNNLATKQKYSEIPMSDIVIIDGVAMLNVMNWPVFHTVRDLVEGVATYVTKQLQPSTLGVHLIFDRYHCFSTKGGKIVARAEVSKLTLDSYLPVKNDSLRVVDNKVQLISLITDNIWMYAKRGLSNRQYIIVSGYKAIPIKVTANSTGNVNYKDLRNSHEEADNIIIHHVVDSVKRLKAKTIHVQSNDTDVFVLLCHFKHTIVLNANIYMVPMLQTLAIDINKTVENNNDIMTHLLSMHAITGCDTVSKPFSIGKITALRALEKGHHPPRLGVLDVTTENLVDDGTLFIGACYGNPESFDTMTEIRISKWKRRPQNNNNQFQLKTLPPTTEAFSLHIHRAHYQAAVWRFADKPDPPHIEPFEYGWEMNFITRSLVPVQLPRNTPIATDLVLKLIHCNCRSTRACKSKNCSCHRGNRRCSKFCRCTGSVKTCYNPFTIPMS